MGNGPKTKKGHSRFQTIKEIGQSMANNDNNCFFIM